jgi:lysine 2,3-aminomutase
MSRPASDEDIETWGNVAPKEWNDWRWQVKNRITDLDTLKRTVHLSPEEEEGVKRCLSTFRMAITPYYASLMDPFDPNCPIRKQAVPSGMELEPSWTDMEDPLYEDTDSPVSGITHRYPDRVLFLITDQCSTYCRHCTRRRLVGETDSPRSQEEIERALDYIRSTPAIRDVLVSGGDALLVPDDWLERIIKSLRAIKHVEIIRIGTRTPVVLPQRITPALCKTLSQYHPIYLNTHFNHPKELTKEAFEACARLADAGIPLGNQTVLLRGVNDCPVIMRQLVQGLLKFRVKPYYLYQCDLSRGISHFRTPISKGLEIIEMLRGHTSGLAVPTFCIDVPGGGGKVPVSPQYLISYTPGTVVLRNYEGMISVYREPVDCYKDLLGGGSGAGNERVFNQGVCPVCGTNHESMRLGIGELLYGDSVSLEPKGMLRAERRKDWH